jgi:hypothetical protein
LKENAVPICPDTEFSWCRNVLVPNCLFQRVRTVLFPGYIHVPVCVICMWFKKLFQAYVYCYCISCWKIDLEKIKNFSRDKLKSNLKDCLKKNFISFWREERTSSLSLNEGKLTTFYKIKETFSREFYLDSLCFKQRSILTKFRLSAHSLRIETGRYEKCKDEGGNVKKN